MKSSPYTQKIVKQAFERMQSGASDKAPTREETEARLAARKQESIKQSAANLPKLESELARDEVHSRKGQKLGLLRQRPKHDS
jgi:hypothetical protein